MESVTTIMAQIAQTLGEFNYISIATRVVLAILLSGIIGWERSKSGRAAGLRTHILVCLGACVISLTGLYLREQYGADPSRMAAQVISGIGFLGTGTILIKNQSEVVGLTTAACIWSTGCIGVALGYGLYWVALLVSVLCFVIMKKLVAWEEGIKHKDNIFRVYGELKDATHTNAFLDDMAQADIGISEIKFMDAKVKSINSIAFSATVAIDPAKDKREVLMTMNGNDKSIFVVATD